MRNQLDCPPPPTLLPTHIHRIPTYRNYTHLIPFIETSPPSHRLTLHLITYPQLLFPRYLSINRTLLGVGVQAAGAAAPHCGGASGAVVLNQSRCPAAVHCGTTSRGREKWNLGGSGKGRRRRRTTTTTNDNDDDDERQRTTNDDDDNER